MTAIQNSVRIGDQLVSFKKPEGSAEKSALRRLFNTISAWNGTTSGQYDAFNATKKVMDLAERFGLGSCYLLDKFKFYLAGTALGNWYRTADTFVKTLADWNQPRTKAAFRWEFSHQITDLATGTAYALSFLAKNAFSATCLTAGMVLGALNDSTDTVYCLMKIRELKTMSVQVKNEHVNPAEGSNEKLVAAAIDNEIGYTWIKCVKAASAAFAGIFGCYLLCTAAAPVVPAYVVGVSLASTIFNIGAYYYQNYACDTTLIPEFKFVQHA